MKGWSTKFNSKTIDQQKRRCGSMMRKKRREEMREGRLEFIAGAIWVCYIVGLRVTVSKATS